MPFPLIVLLLICSVSAFGQPEATNAQQLFDDGKYAEARVLYLKLHHSEPSDALFVERLGDVDSHLANWPQAARYYQRLTQLRPSDAEGHYKYGGALAMQAAQANKLKALGMIGEVRACFEKAIVLNPRHVAARWALVEYYLQVPGIFGGSESQAHKYANELSRLSPVDHYLAKGRIEEYFGRYENAEKHYLKAHSIGNSANTKKKLDAIRAKTKNR
ncbi:tetratricopeptide repeat protein [Flavobacterium selenitireducens]|uniref:tetratricopeptide repeat protein n=1 Tax=Flavobacterium selenitireducens TaxID=2722704 RepID=UPI00168BB7C8|nr:tetratricopeptide repeat protein [Flavobacterium selenitireducens]MBD3583990.1 hypothetical protein [Flavobacterium selenitireducens]